MRAKFSLASPLPMRHEAIVDAAPRSDDVPAPGFGPRMVWMRCGIVGLAPGRTGGRCARGALLPGRDEIGIDEGKGRLQLRTQRVDDPNDGDGNASGDRAIFDSGAPPDLSRTNALKVFMIISELGQLVFCDGEFRPIPDQLGGAHDEDVHLGPTDDEAEVLE
jgi:hypothetical protein